MPIQQVAVQHRARVPSHGAVGKHHVDGLRFQLRQQLTQGARAHDDRNVRTRHQGAQEFHLEVARKRRQRPDLQDRPVHRRLATQGAQQFVPRLEHGVRVVQRDPAGLGQHQATAQAVEQRVAQLRFELGQLHRHRRLRQVQPFSGLGQAARVGNGPEVAQMVIVQLCHLTLP